MRRLTTLMMIPLSVSVIYAKQMHVGTLSVIVLKDGKALSNGEIVIDNDKSYRTDEDGYTKLSLARGFHQVQIFEKDEQGNNLVYVKKKVAIEKNKNSQLIITLKSTETKAKADIQTPKLKAMQEEIKAVKEHGFIALKVTSSENKSPIAGARVFVKGSPIEAKTDKSGFAKFKVPVGEHTISVIHGQYSSQTISKIAVTKEATTAKSASLTPASLELEEFVVLAPSVSGSIAAVIDEQKNTDSVADIVGAEQFSKQGDSDAAGALKRVSGLTLVGGKFIYIRGLGERYTTSQLNSLNLPSPEPTKRVVPLDLFPTGVIKSIKIQKTYSSDLPANFGGGNINIRTKDVPKEFFMNASFSLKYNDVATFETMNSYQGGKYDWTGYDDTRGLNGYTKGILDSFTSVNRLEDEEQNAIKRDLIKTPSQFKSKKVPLGYKLSASVGDSYELGQTSKLGYVLSYSYDDSYEAYQSFESSIAMADGEVLAPDEYDSREVSNHEIKQGGIFGLNLDINENHKIKQTNLLINQTNDVTNLKEGTNEDSNEIRRYLYSWVERTLMVNQLEGTHTIEEFDNLRINWAVENGQATRGEPLTKEYTYMKQNDIYQIMPQYSMNIVSSELEDTLLNYKFDVAYPFFLTDDEELESYVEFGINNLNKKRDSKTRRLALKINSRYFDEEMRKQEVDNVFSEENLDSIILLTPYKASDYYKASNDASSLYIKSVIKPSSRYFIELGLRKEESKQKVDTYDSSKKPIIYALDTDDLLPSITATLKINETMQLRAGLSKTLSRPDFREFSPVRYQDPVTSDIIFGNGDLTYTQLENYDLRYEWYPSSTETFSTALFYKKFKNPIETISLPYDTPTYTFINADAATLYGLEVGGRYGLGFASESLSNFYLGGNITYSISSIEVSEEKAQEYALTNVDRPMQGQSPYVVNAKLGYDDKDNRSATLLYNVFAERIMGVGSLGYPDIYEEPFHQVDFVWIEKFPKNISFKFKVKNILDDTKELTQGDVIIRESKKGRGFDVGLSYKF
jgi:TonB-dependent receptor